MPAAADTNVGHYVHANGIDIHYVEQGSGPPLVLLNNGMISTNPIWAEWISSYEHHRAALADHFHVIEPDFRGSGRTSSRTVLSRTTSSPTTSRRDRRWGSTVRTSVVRRRWGFGDDRRDRHPRRSGRS